MRDMARVLVFSFFVAVLVVHGTRAQTEYKVCAKDGNSQECQSLEKGNSKVICVKVTDSIDCLMKMDEGKADFFVMTPEELILSTIVKPEKFHVVASIRNNERKFEKFQFEAVALVKEKYTGGVEGLSRKGFCHPGYGKAKEQLWSDRVLKYFERKVAGKGRKCNPKSMSAAEDEINNLSSFFSNACRPGPWVIDPVEDKRLKEKYPTLCSLCASNKEADCDGYRYFEPRTNPGLSVNSHLSAIECLTQGKGAVSYVAYAHVLEYFKNNVTEMNGYALLCENGTTIPLKGESIRPEPECAWLSQPWGVLLARKEISDPLLNDIKAWMPTGRSNGERWIDSLVAILLKDRENELFDYPDVPKEPREYITQGRPMPEPDTPCSNPLRWCTVSDQEQDKCMWIKSASLTLGMQPDITCVRGMSQLDCLSLIKQERADFISADSNLGFIARKHYNATAVLYHETSRSMTSKVFAIIKEKHRDLITRFENLRDKNACFPEYGGIGWVSFMRTAHEKRVISSNECDYAREIVNFFSEACAPGSTDPAHFPTKSADPNKLCIGCRRGFSPRDANEQGLVSQTSANYENECPANPNNIYYGNKGALKCLSEEESHVAFIEGQNLEEHAKNLSLSPDIFRILCRNGSLAANTGFKVDDKCALSVTIDSEVVSRRNDKNNLNTQLYLQELDSCFGYNVRSILIDFEVFSPFNDSKNLLFKDSTIGLTKSDSEKETVQNYIELFRHVESCTGGAGTVVVSAILSMFVVAVHSLKYLV